MRKLYHEPYAYISSYLRLSSLPPAKFKNAPSPRNISVNFRPLYVTPSVSNITLTKSQINKAQRVEELYPEALEIHKEDLDFFWILMNLQTGMEDSFTKAIEYSNDKWGRADFVLNEKALPVVDPKGKTVVRRYEIVESWT
jgi:hypothetical protein